MSVTTTKAAQAQVATPVVVRGWTAGRARRARMFAALLALVAAAALWSAFQPWYGFATAGTPRCDRPSVVAPVTVTTPGNASPVGGVYASGCITGRELAMESDALSDPSMARAQTILASQNTAASPDALFGLPRTVTLVLLASLIGMVGLLLRNGWLGLLGILAFFYAHKDLGNLRAVMSAGTGGALNADQSGLALFGWALVLGWLLLLCSTLFVAKHNADERHQLKLAAKADGLPGPMGPMDHVAAFIGGKVAKVIDAAEVERARTKAAVAD